MTDSQIKQCTAKIKAMADVRHLAIEDIDSIINEFEQNLGREAGGERPLLKGLTAEEKQQFQVKEREMAAEPEARELDHVVEEQTKVLNGAGEVDGREEKVEALNGEGVVVNGTA